MVSSSVCISYLFGSALGIRSVTPQLAPHPQQLVGCAPFAHERIYPHRKRLREGLRPPAEGNYLQRGVVDA